ncbi:polysaccharide export protein [Colwellia sp. MSW7]|jgi:polysaccharide export outer membrane protein|uniref:Polysaccharide export protein n=1 Tax=Colwellia maritima TaxID=2912588 RepID=A0ABS9X4B7_9GAMM|nr:polysaccharide biosynthesis/export family protein [Colwellia maritima]MCI2285100.1 polysaccharide export protein [Colwellia maritima]
MRLLALLFFLLYSNSSIVAAGDYLLGAGDSIEIVVYGEKDLTTKVKIGRSGLVSFPFLEPISVLGLSVTEVKNKIYTGLLGDYLINPQVAVSIVEYRPFFIHGEVVKPGGFPYQEDLRLDKAIALAGGLTNRASKEDWIITRTVQGTTVTIEASIATLIQPDDIIKIEQSFF